MIYMPIKLAELRGEIRKSTIIVKYFSDTSLRNLSSRQKIHKDVGDLNNTFNNVIRTIYLIAAEYSSSAKNRFEIVTHWANKFVPKDCHLSVLNISYVPLWFVL